MDDDMYKTIYTMSFVEDQVVIAQDADGIDCMTNKLVEECGR